MQLNGMKIDINFYVEYALDKERKYRYTNSLKVNYRLYKLNSISDF